MINLLEISWHRDLFLLLHGKIYEPVALKKYEKYFRIMGRTPYISVTYLALQTDKL